MIREIKGDPLRFDFENMAAIYEYIGANELGGVAQIYGLVWGGIIGHSTRTGHKLSFTKDDVIEYVDDRIMNGDDFADVFQLLTDSKKWQSLINKGEEIEEKKKVEMKSSLTITE